MRPPRPDFTRNPPGPLIIDCHTHLNRYGPEQPDSLEDRYALLKERMALNGVRYALVLSSYTANPDRPTTEQLVRMVDGDPQVGVIAGVCFARGPENEAAAIREMLQDGHVRGIKLYPGYEPFYVHDPRLRPIHELAGEFDVPVVMHTGDTYNPKAKVKYAHPLEIDEVAVEFREVRFVMCHLGNPWFTDAMEVLYKNDNVVADLSGFTLGDFEPRFEGLLLRRLRDVMAFMNDPEKLMYGTDWPIAEMPSYLRFMQRIDATPGELEGMMWRNANRVFRLGLEEDGGKGEDDGATQG